MMIRTLLNLARPHLWPLMISLLCRVMNQLGTIAILVVAGHYAQALFTGEASAIWEQLLWPLLWIGIGKAFCRYAEQLSGHNAAFRIQEDLRNRIYWQLEQQAPDNIHALSTGELTARVVSDIERIEVFYAHTIVPVLSAVLVSLMVTLYGYQLGGTMAAVSLLSLLALVGAAIPTYHLLRYGELGQNIRQQFGQLNVTLTDVVTGINEIQNWQAMPFFKQQVAKQGAALQQSHSALARRNGIKDAMTDGVIGLGFVGLLVVAWWQEGSTTLTALPVLCLYAGAFGPVLALTRTFEDLPQTFPACRRVLAMLQPMVSDDVNPIKSDFIPADDSPLIAVSSLSHRYPNSSHWLFKDLSLTLSSSRHMVIQGESGSGKTSLLRYLAGVYVCQDSPVTLKGHPMTELSRVELWQQISYVPQQTIIFPASLRHNLSLGQRYSDAMLLEVLQLVCLEPMFHLLANGLDTELGLNGARVSGGEAQRIALARAILRDTPIYLLDEAFSALDKTTEATIRQRLTHRWKDKLVVEVAHQPKGLSASCELWKMQDGRLMI
ncbi:amino acid ABC transporter ATP-binding/permease protein [Vibrio sp. TRT 21S02]|uniref:amino acid ABC transporter ATP-binding/permease protein n=1 Tax=Vibrio sp. TRT 21S02 TaxID=3418507 RepID=UPI003CE805B8